MCVCVCVCVCTCVRYVHASVCLKNALVHYHYMDQLAMTGSSPVWPCSNIQLFNIRGGLSSNSLTFVFCTSNSQTVSSSQQPRETALSANLSYTKHALIALIIINLRKSHGVTVSDDAIQLNLELETGLSKTNAVAIVGHLTSRPVM